MGSGSASVIVRTKDSALDLEELLPVLRRQTVPVEIVVMDSGSHDGTQAVADRLANQLIRLEPGLYTPGRALNVAARSATADIHFALSSHCRPPDDGWIERSLAHYQRADVAATNGARTGPDGQPIRGVLLGGAGDAQPDWGYSNHASSWRAAVWRDHPFDEELSASEDRKWALEVTQAGWLIAHDPSLVVDMSHRWRNGARAYFQRTRNEELAIGSFATLPPYTPRRMLVEWWWHAPDDHHSVAFHRLVNYKRAAGLLGQCVGRWQAAYRRGRQ